MLCSFFLVAFSILHLPLIFVSLTIMFLSVVFLGLIPCRTLCLLDWVIASFSMLGKFSAVTSSNIFSGLFSLSSPSGTKSFECWCFWHCLRGVLNCAHFLSFFFFILFISSDFQHSGHLYVFLLRLFCYWFLLLHFSFHFLFNSGCSLFSSLKTFCNFSYCTAFSQVLESSLFSFTWTLSQVNCLYPLHSVVFLGFCLVPLKHISFLSHFVLNSICVFVYVVA